MELDRWDIFVRSAFYRKLKMNLGHPQSGADWPGRKGGEVHLGRSI